MSLAFSPLFSLIEAARQVGSAVRAAEAFARDSRSLSADVDRSSAGVPL